MNVFLLWNYLSNKSNYYIALLAKIDTSILKISKVDLSSSLKKWTIRKMHSKRFHLKRLGSNNWASNKKIFDCLSRKRFFVFAGIPLTLNLPSLKLFSSLTFACHSSLSKYSEYQKVLVSNTNCYVSLFTKRWVKVHTQNKLNS